MALMLGEEQIPLMFIGEMGIKRAHAGNERVYERNSSYFYLELCSSPNNQDETTFLE